MLRERERWITDVYQGFAIGQGEVIIISLLLQCFINNWVEWLERGEGTWRFVLHMTHHRLDIKHYTWTDRYVWKLVIQWQKLKVITWFNVVVEKSESMTVSGFHLYRLYRLRRVWRNMCQIRIQGVQRKSRRDTL